MDQSATDASISDRLQTLADLRECGFTYPDGSAVDCGLTIAQGVVGQVPAGWSCVDRLDAGELDYSLWSDLLGNYGIEYEATWPGKFYGRATFVSGSESQAVTFHGPRHNFVRFPSTAVSDPFNLATAQYYGLELAAFEMEGHPGLVTTDNLSVGVTDYDGNLWYVWQLHGTSGDYYLQEMRKLSAALTGDEPTHHWIPGSFRVTGQDFSIMANATFLLAPMHSAAPIYAFRGGCD